tara:strand:+ start:168 stop:338 length:171 start_codon:yes stop_codon:yes gene_type:complete
MTVDFYTQVAIGNPSVSNDEIAQFRCNVLLFGPVIDTLRVLIQPTQQYQPKGGPDS